MGTFFLHALRAMGHRTRDAFRDPIRKRHVWFRALEGFLGGLAVECVVLQWLLIDEWVTWRDIAAWGWGVALVLVPLAAPLVEFLVYEFLLEPWSRRRVAHGKPSWVGPYWERGPRDEESFWKP